MAKIHPDVYLRKYPKLHNIRNINKSINTDIQEQTITICLKILVVTRFKTEFKQLRVLPCDAMI